MKGWEDESNLLGCGTWPVPWQAHEGARFTRALIETAQVRVVGAPWMAGESKVIGRDAAVSNVLCDYHNNQLSRGPDKAAVRLRRLLIFGNDPLRRPGSTILQPPPEVRISGVQVARWLCKTHCNVLAAAGRTPKPAYVAYAFQQKPAEHIWFYFQHHPGRKIRFGDTDEQAIARYVYLARDSDDKDAFSINLCGYKTLVSRERIGYFRMQLMRWLEESGTTASDVWSSRRNWGPTASTSTGRATHA